MNVRPEPAESRRAERHINHLLVAERPVLRFRQQRQYKALKVFGGRGESSVRDRTPVLRRTVGDPADQEYLRLKSITHATQAARQFATIRE